MKNKIIDFFYAQLFNLWIAFGRYLVRIPFFTYWNQDNRVMAVIASWSLEYSQKVVRNWDLQDRYDALLSAYNKVKGERDAAFDQLHELEKNK